MASYTEHLELLKKDPVADGADTFNIQTMLNDNWEKIDAAVAGKADVGEDGKIPASQLPEMDYDPAGSAAAVQTNLTAHINNKNNPHGVTAAQAGARPNTWVPAWGDVTGKPGTFPPSGHTHDTSQMVSGILPAARGGTGVGSIAELASLLAGQGMPKIYTTSYIGTGTYGINNKTSLVFPSPPKLVLITSPYGVTYLGAFVYGASTAPTIFSGSTSSGGMGVTISGWGTNTISWSGSNANYQLNKSESEYRVLALL